MPQDPVISDVWVSRLSMQAQPVKGERHHSHSYYELLYLTDGGRQVTMHEHLWLAEAGDLMIYRPGQLHADCSPRGGVGMWVLRFTEEARVRSGIPFPSLPGQNPVVRLPTRDRLASVLTRLHEEESLGGPYREQLQGSLLTEFLVHLQRGCQQLCDSQERSGDAQERVRRIVERLRQYRPLDVDVTELAKQVGLSRTHFNRVFHEVAGSSPKRFLVDMRIDRACELLRQTDLRLQSIAEILGYSSPYFFYRQFKERRGCTCSQYREQHRRD